MRAFLLGLMIAIVAYAVVVAVTDDDRLAAVAFLVGLLSPFLAEWRTGRRI